MVNFADIKTTLSGTLETVSMFTVGFNKVMDCWILRVVVESVEIGMCYNVRKNFFLLFVFLFLITWIMLVLNCTICCSIKRKQTKGKREMDFEPHVGLDEKHLAKAW